MSQPEKVCRTRIHKTTDFAILYMNFAVLNINDCGYDIFYWKRINKR